MKIRVRRPGLKPPLHWSDNGLVIISRPNLPHRFGKDKMSGQNDKLQEGRATLLILGRFGYGQYMSGAVAQ